jgi:hypothetical protein
MKHSCQVVGLVTVDELLSFRAAQYSLYVLRIIRIL